jgi:hypothetical protein
MIFRWHLIGICGRQLERADGVSSKIDSLRRQWRGNAKLGRNGWHYRFKNTTTHLRAGCGRHGLSELFMVYTELRKSAPIPAKFFSFLINSPLPAPAQPEALG